MKSNQHNCNNADRLAQKIAFLENPEKRGDIPPDELFGMLPINKTDHILDFGAGSGYLTIPAAKRVDGQVYALDIDPQMLDIINAKAHDEQLTNIQTVQGNPDTIPLPNDSIDLTFASLVLHEVKPLPTILQQINDVLKEGGHFVCVEIEAKEVSIDGPPRIPSPIMEQELLNAGFSITQKLFPSENIYIIIAQK